MAGRCIQKELQGGRSSLRGGCGGSRAQARPQPEPGQAFGSGLPRWHPNGWEERIPTGIQELPLFL